MEILGNIDRCDEECIEGWVTVADAPEMKLSLEIMLDQSMLGSCKADLFREDLQKANLADGKCAFRFEMPGFVPKGDVARIVVRLAKSAVFLAGAHKNGIERSSRSGDYFSRFGGLWIDRYDWAERLAQKHRLGEISDELSLAIFKFVRDGYLIIEGAVSTETIDRLNKEIEAFWKKPPDGLLIETFEPDGKMHYIPPNLAWREGRTKMLDLFVYSATAREAIAAPKTMEFLAAIFEDTPKAFQSLNFWTGSQQDMHKDTAYVKVDSNPMHLAATWLALEDIQPGTGELEYYVGSHRAPDFVFGKTSKWMEAEPQEHSRFLASLHEDAKVLGHRKGSFLAKKGDVLIWHADLAHGGSKITKPKQSRRSLVTHFTKASNEPFYARTGSRRVVDAKGCRFVSQFGSVTCC